MDWIDYREKLGIGFNDPEKFSYFITKIFNYLNLFASSSSLAVLSTSEYCDFCNVIGSKLNIDILNNYDSTKRYEECIQVLRKNSKDLKSFLTYYVAFTNANKKNKQNYNREQHQSHPQRFSRKYVGLTAPFFVVFFCHFKTPLIIWMII